MAQVRSEALGTTRSAAGASRSASTVVRSCVTVTGTRNTSTPPVKPATSIVCGRSAGNCCGTARSTTPVAGSTEITSTPAVSSQAWLHAASD